MADGWRHWNGLLALGLVALAGCLPATAHAQRRHGCEAIVYVDANFEGGEWRVFHDEAELPAQWNDQISSIRVRSGVWEFYWDWDYVGELLRLRPGNYPFVGEHWNDQISSFRCVHPTD